MSRRSAKWGPCYREENQAPFDPMRLTNLFFTLINALQVRRMEFCHVRRVTQDISQHGLEIGRAGPAARAPEERRFAIIHFPARAWGLIERAAHRLVYSMVMAGGGGGGGGGGCFRECISGVDVAVRHCCLLLLGVCDFGTRLVLPVASHLKFAVLHPLCAKNWLSEQSIFLASSVLAVSDTLRNPLFSSSTDVNIFEQFPSSDLLIYFGAPSIPQVCSFECVKIFGWSTTLSSFNILAWYQFPVILVLFSLVFWFDEKPGRLIPASLVLTFWRGEDWGKYIRFPDAGASCM
eukprot:Gb_12557 [translate_table: standard]